MSLNQIPISERIHIGFFGKRNAGKSSLINAITNQKLSIVSEIKGTTTDPVSKSMELLPLGPVVVIDTPGFDDEGDLGKLRIEKTYEILNKVDIAVLVTDVQSGITKEDENIISLFKNKNIEYIIVYNKADLPYVKKDFSDKNQIYVSASENININELKELIAVLYNNKKNDKKLINDVVNKEDVVILVTPIDSAAPKGRLILPQQQVIRDLLDGNAVSVVVKESELQNAIDLCKDKVKLVITDSQVFKKVNEITPKNIYLTSFSIIFARYKGVLKTAVKGVNAINSLKNNDKILISEGCTHHRQCDDIGTVKLPKWLNSYTGKNFDFEFSSGGSFPSDLTKYSLVIHCGSCMLNEREVLHRYESASIQKVPITNYGTAIAYVNGILKRSLEIFPDIYNIL